MSSLSTKEAFKVLAQSARSADSAWAVLDEIAQETSRDDFKRIRKLLDDVEAMKSSGA